MEKAVDTYLNFQNKVKKLSGNTVSSYRRDLYAFAVYLQEKSISYKKVKKTDIYEYISQLQHKGKSQATVARVVASIRNFYHYLCMSGNMKKDPSSGISAPKIEKKLPGILTLSEVDRLLSQPSGTSYKERRDKAMLELLYATGIRVSELIELTVDNLDMDNYVIMFIENGKQRIVPFGNQAHKALELYFESSPYHSEPGISLFTNLYGKKLTRQGFWKIIKHYKVMAAIKKDITPQMLRHSFAAHLMDNGIDNSSLQELMGYSAIASVKKYEELSGKRIVDIYKKVHPRA
ncbi:MAG: tyrosine-type recombinase/integrase [Clostridia bacterium]|nr:tyrosine-type recombinase/integrase [Clostridia bacterium]